MKKLLATIATVFVLTSGVFFVSAYSEEGMKPQPSMGSMSEMCQSMMNSVPKDVIIRTTSSQVVNIGNDSMITLLVTDKAGKPLDNASVILHIEKGAPMESMGSMSMMDMMGRMVQAENLGSGNYQVKFSTSEKGYYTMHTHAIPDRKSMMSMMNNHMDIGIIAK
jgi:hypothetical protein